MGVSEKFAASDKENTSFGVFVAHMRRQVEVEKSISDVTTVKGRCLTLDDKDIGRVRPVEGHFDLEIITRALVPCRRTAKFDEDRRGV